MSPKSTSAASPREITVEKPTWCGSAQSRIAVQSAPDWETSARSPGMATPLQKVMFSPRRGRNIPRQFGPTMRMP